MNLFRKRFHQLVLYSKHNPWIMAGWVFLVFATLYSGWYASYKISTNADALVYPYMFMGMNISDVLFPSEHTNLVKFPLFALQGALPYNIVTFTFANIGLHALTFITSAIILAYMISKKYTAVLLFLMGTLLISSPSFVSIVMGNTIRNIEYSIALGFFVIIAAILLGKIRSRLHMWISGAGLFLYAATVAGDSFFLYTFSMVALISAFLFYLQQGKLRPSNTIIQAFIIIIVTSIAAYLMRKGLSLAGARLYTATEFVPRIVSANDLLPSIVEPLPVMLERINANIFGIAIRPSNAIIFVNFMIMLVSLFGFWRYLHSKDNRINPSTSVKDAALYMTMLSLPVIYTVYVLSGLATSGGEAAIAANTRYISFLPIIMPIGFIVGVELIKNKTYRAAVTKWLPFFLVISLLLSTSLLRQINSRSDFRVHSINYAKDIVAVLKKHKVESVVTGYWNSSTLRFWSENTIQTASITNCDIPDPRINNKQSWYNPSPSMAKSALVITRQGPDIISWQCQNEKLQSLYGKPHETITMRNTSGRLVDEIWIYNYDVRSTPHKNTDRIFR